MEFSRDAEQMDSRHHYQWMLSGAQSTAEYLREGWKRPVRHNRALELAALWYTIELDLSCRGTVDTAGALSLPVSASTANQYEVLAAAYVLPRLIPFTLDEIGRLRPKPDIMADYHFERGLVTQREPRLVERWHEWIWTGRTEGAAGPGDLLVEGCDRLSEALSRILDEPPG